MLHHINIVYIWTVCACVYLRVCTRLLLYCFPSSNFFLSFFYVDKKKQEAAAATFSCFLWGCQAPLYLVLALSRRGFSSFFLPFCCCCCYTYAFWLARECNPCFMTVCLLYVSVSVYILLICYESIFSCCWFRKSARNFIHGFRLFPWRIMKSGWASLFCF